MKLRNPLLLACVLTVAAPAAASGPATTGALPTRANDIAGLWTGEGRVGPCGSGLTPATVRNTLLFHAGGSVVENTRFPPGGAPNVNGVAGQNQRGMALGTWSYNPATREYSMFLRFDWFVDGVYHGYQTVERLILLSNDGDQAAGPVRSTRYTANGSIISNSEVCGSAVSVRVPT